MTTARATAQGQGGFALTQGARGRRLGRAEEASAGTRALAQEIAEFFQHENGALRAAADELESALLHASGSNYRRVQEAVATLRLLCGKFEAEMQTRFRDEESIIFPLLEMKAPQLRGLVGELGAELERIRRALAEFRRELTVFNTTGELRHLPQLGRELTRALRAYLDGEERELLPALERGLARVDSRWLREVEVLSPRL
jgi:hypothetical protein